MKCIYWFKGEEILKSCCKYKKILHDPLILDMKCVFTSHFLHQWILKIQQTNEKKKMKMLYSLHSSINRILSESLTV